MRGMEEFFTDLTERPEFVHALFEKLYQIQRSFHEVGIKAAGKYVDILRLSGEDLAARRGR